ncbi:MAG: hypothetical protein RL095_3437 [Verrucomicrobiota bacterium]|jgi:hypothetical protein
MKLLLLLLSCFFCLDLAAQIQLGVTTEREKYLRDEAVGCEIIIINSSGAQLRFDNLGASVRIIIIDENKQQLKPFKVDYNPIDGRILAAGETRTLNLNINEHYPLSKAGKYTLAVELSHPAFKVKFVSQERQLDISHGTSLLKRDFGMKDPLDARKVVQRYYELMKFKPAQGADDIVCLKIADDKFVYGLHRLGAHVNGVDIGHDIDSLHSIHTLIQVKSKLFVHSVFSPSGELKQSVVYRAADKEVLSLDHSSPGKISVKGGIKLTEGVDYRRAGNDITLTPNPTKIHD